MVNIVPAGLHTGIPHPTVSHITIPFRNESSSYGGIIFRLWHPKIAKILVINGVYAALDSSFAG